MPYLAYLALAGGAAVLASAQNASAMVTQVLIPIADQQPLVASVIGESPNSIKTLAIQCPPDTDSSDCGFPEPITITAGPSTFHFQPPPTGYYNLLGEIDCTLTESTEMACGATIGVYDTEYIATATDTEWINTPATTSTTTSATLSGTDVVWISVTITAGLDEAEESSASTTGGESGSQTGSGSGNIRSTSTAESGSGTSSGATAIATGNGAVGFSGFAHSGAAAGLLALPMLLL